MPSQNCGVAPQFSATLPQASVTFEKFATAPKMSKVFTPTSPTRRVANALLNCVATEVARNDAAVPKDRTSGVKPALGAFQTMIFCAPADYS